MNNVNLIIYFPFCFEDEYFSLLFCSFGAILALEFEGINSVLEVRGKVKTQITQNKSLPYQ